MPQLSAMQLTSISSLRDPVRGSGPRIDVALAIIGTLIIVCLVFWVLMAPELFFGQIPVLIPAAVVLLFAVAITTTGWVGILIKPPAGLASTLIILAFCMMDFSIRKGGVVPGSFDGQSILKGAIWCVVLLFGSVLGARAIFKNAITSLLFLYCLYAFLSSLYSPSIGLGLGSGVALLAIAMYGAAVSQWNTSAIVCLWRRLFYALSAMAIVSLVLYVVLPEWARDLLLGDGRLRGLTGSGNSLGPLVAIGAVIGLYCIQTAKSVSVRVISILFLLADLVALVLTQSRSAMIATISCLLVPFAISKPRFSPFLGAIGISGYWVSTQPDLMQGALQAVTQLISRSGDIREITSLTGRSEIWSAVVRLWLESPWIGYGLGSPRTLISEAPISRWQTFESSHNWLLESLLSFGIVGTTLLIAFICLLGWAITRWYFRSVTDLKSKEKLTKSLESEQLSLCVMRCFVFLLINGMTEKAFAGMPSPGTVLFGILTGTVLAFEFTPAAKKVSRIRSFRTASVTP